LHAPALRLVRDQMADQAAGHLVQFLVGLVSVGDALAKPDRAKRDGRLSQG
jgi:hypothetical protein